MRDCIRRAGFCKTQRAVVAVLTPAIALVIDGAARGGGAAVWSGASVSITHNPGSPGGSSFNVSPSPVPSGTAVLQAPFNPHVDNFTVNGNSVNTNASAGMSHSESATSCQLSFASGTGVSQTDPGHQESSSSLDINFLTEWNVPSNGFGAPVCGSFSLPYGAKIGPNGSASISILVNWDVINGAAEFPLKNYTVPTTTYEGGASGTTILTSFTAPTTLFSPSSFTSGEVIVIQGDITFTADNNSSPTLSEIPTASDFGLSTKSLYLMPATIGGIIPNNLVWSGSVSGTWDTGLTPNFYNAGAASVFNTGDNVTFNDNPAQYNVAINSAVSPTSMIVNNSSGSYTFAGIGSIIGGGQLTKNGIAALTLSTSNTFVGGVTLNAGTLNIDNASALGTGTFNIAGGAIDNTSTTPIVLTTANPQIWSGDFTFGGTNSLNLGAGPVTLTGNRTINTLGAGVLTIGGTISGSGGLTKNGPGILALSAAETYTGSTVINAGTLSIVSSSTTGITSISLPGGLNIGSGAVVDVAPAAVHSFRTLLTIGSLTFGGTNGGGLLDLANNDMDVQSGTLSSVISEVTRGYNAGGWNGGGGITSSSAAGDTTHLTTLGVIQNNSGSGQLYGYSGPLGLFDGSNPAPADLLVKFTYYGDTNLDGQIDGSDYSRIDAGFLARATTWFNGDFNYDGTINGSDYTLIDNAFNSQGASLAGSIADPTATITAQLPAGSSSVPEPATLGSCLITLALLRRRR